jgi:hypothetical protein
VPEAGSGRLDSADMVWDTEQYWKKARRYAELAAQSERENWERPFWLSLAVEFLARACLTKIHPVLNADPEQDGANLLYAFGCELKGQPKSLPIHAVFLRLEKILPESFSKPRREFCDYFSNLRNQELHTSELPFESLSEQKWLPRFYDVCAVLCKQLEKSLPALFDAKEAETAEELIVALKKEKVSKVHTKMASHRHVFEGKPPEERTRIASEQATLSNAWAGTKTKVKCPACGSLACLQGRVERVSKPMWDEPELVVKNIVLASHLECKACDLVLADIEELLIAEIEPHFEYFETVDLHEYHESDYGEEYDNM